MLKWLWCKNDFNCDSFQLLRLGFLVWNEPSHTIVVLSQLFLVDKLFIEWENIQPSTAGLYLWVELNDSNHYRFCFHFHQNIVQPYFLYSRQAQKVVNTSWHKPDDITFDFMLKNTLTCENRSHLLYQPKIKLKKNVFSAFPREHLDVLDLNRNKVRETDETKSLVRSIKQPENREFIKLQK